jgi:hypothetical protein
MEVTIISASGDKGTWSVPKALLSRSSGYFQRATRPGTFKESDENKVTIQDFEPDTFQLFVEFIYYSRYSYHDNLNNNSKVRDSAKAWVLGDYLDAVEFKNFAIRTLYYIYFPSDCSKPKCGVGPKAIEHCCTKATEESGLVALYLSVLVVYWGEPGFISYVGDSSDEWDAIWERHHGFRNNLLRGLSQEKEDRKAWQQGLAYYVDEIVTSDGS